MLLKFVASGKISVTGYIHSIYAALSFGIKTRSESQSAEITSANACALKFTQVSSYRERYITRAKLCLEIVAKLDHLRNTSIT